MAYHVRTLEKAIRASVAVPGSKSFTHRMLVAAALSDGRCTIDNALDSEDTRLTSKALQLMGAPVCRRGSAVVVNGFGGRPKPVASPIDLNNSGTSMRLLTAVAALGNTPYRLTGSGRMQRRPIQDLIDSLRQMGVAARSVAKNGCPPVEICGPPGKSATVEVNCGVSSQYLSALMLIAPHVSGGLEIAVKKGPVSRPYIDITAEVMRSFGVDVQRSGYARFTIAGGQAYLSGDHTVEPDASQAGYFWAAAALTGSTITVNGIGRRSVQGDLGLVDLLEALGCRADRCAAGITVTGGRLEAIDADLADMPDVAPTLAVVAAFARGVTRLRNVGHLAVKESNRLEAVIAELDRLGIGAELQGQDLVVSGGNPRGARIETYNDHRIAMSFAVAGLRVPGIVIRDPACVEKSFPRFWKVLESLYKNQV